MSDALTRSQLFAKVPTRELDVLLNACSSETLLAGDQLFAEGDESDALWLIDRGSVEVFKTIRDGVDRVITALGPGAVLGEMGFLDGRRRSAGARATEPADVRLLRRSVFDDIAAAHPNLAAGFFAGLASVVADRLRLTTELYRQSVAAWMEATRTDVLNLQRLTESVQPLQIHLVGGAHVNGRILEFEQAAPGWTLTIQDDEGRVAIVPYHAVTRIEAARAR